jgi:hypothetical protein
MTSHAAAQLQSLADPPLKHPPLPGTARKTHNLALEIALYIKITISYLPIFNPLPSELGQMSEDNGCHFK